MIRDLDIKVVSLEVVVVSDLEVVVLMIGILYVHLISLRVSPIN